MDKVQLSNDSFSVTFLMIQFEGICPTHRQCYNRADERVDRFCDCGTGSKLQTSIGKAIYALRKETVEPVIGIFKEVLGFR